MPITTRASDDGRLVPRLMLAGALAALCMTTLPAAAGERDCAAAERTSPGAYKICLSSLVDLLDLRVRHALDVALMAAADRDELESGTSYGRHVRILDREQSVWEERMEATCALAGAGSGRETGELNCRVTSYRERLHELGNKDD